MDARYTLDAQGTFSGSREGQRSLGERAGQYLLVPTSPDWLCFVRQDVGGAERASARVVLAGDAGAFPMQDLIGFCGQARWTGMFRLKAADGDRTIFLKDGEVRGATSDNPSDRVGEVMVRMGFVQRAQLDEALRQVPPSKIGRTLVERNLLQPHDLWKCLTEQVSAIFHSMMLCKSGVFLLIDQAFDDRAAHNLSLSLQNLLMDSIRKIDELAHFRKRVPHGRMFVARRKPSDGSLEPDEDAVLALVDGKRSVLELASLAKLAEFDATKIVYRLLEGGFVQLTDRAVQSAPAPRPQARTTTEDLLAQRVVLTFNQIFREIFDEVARHKGGPALVASVNKALEQQALTPSLALEGLALDDSGQFAVDALLAQYARAVPQLGSEPAASLRQALSDVMFFLLFQAGEMLDPAADEQLARRVKTALANLDAG